MKELDRMKEREKESEIKREVDKQRKCIQIRWKGHFKMSLLP